MSTAMYWTLIAGFFALMVAYSAAILTAVNAKLDRIDARFETVLVKIEHLDRDVQALTTRLMGDKP